MPGWAARLWSSERDLKMVWEVIRHDRRSRLVGTAQFFPYRFRGAIRDLIARARSVLLEGPMDEASLRKVADTGSKRAHASLYPALDERALLRLCRMLDLPVVPRDVPEIYRQVLFGRPDQWLEAELRDLRPWMAFLGLWTRFRTGLGNAYSLDLEAARTAERLGKAVAHLETIEEQIAALDAIPLERIVGFIADADWHAYSEAYVFRYLEGDLEGLMAVARAFPTFCHAVIDRRDPLLAERLLPAFEAGDACAFVGITHIPGVSARLRENGYDVAPISWR